MHCNWGDNLWLRNLSIWKLYATRYVLKWQQKNSSEASQYTMEELAKFGEEYYTATL